MPGQAGTSAAAAGQFICRPGVDIMHGVGLHRLGILPAIPEGAEAAFHRSDRGLHLFPHTIRAEIAGTHGPLRIIPAALPPFSAAGDDEARRLARAWPREGERVKRRLARGIDLRADIASRHRICRPVEDAPLCERLDVMLIEGPDSLVGKGCRRTQLAGAKRRQWSPRGLDVVSYQREAFGQWRHLVEPHTLNLVAGAGRGAP